MRPRKRRRHTSFQQTTHWISFVHIRRAVSIAVLSVAVTIISWTRPAHGTEPLAPFASATSCPHHFLHGIPPALLNQRLAERTTFLCNDAFAALASGVTRGAIWSAEHLTAENVAAARGLERLNRFRADVRLPRRDRAENVDYARRGFDRGHLAPSGNMPTARAQSESFLLSNMVPQTPGLNRGEWSAIEEAVRDLATARGALYVVTGVLFEGGTVQSIGRRSHAVLVPTHTWKAALDPTTGDAWGWLCPNVAVPVCEIPDITALTLRTGIEPFPRLD